LKKIAGREAPKEILRMVEKVLEDDAEVIFYHFRILLLKCGEPSFSKYSK